MEIGKKAIKLYDDPNRSNRIILKLDITKIKSRNLEICVLGKESSYTAIQIDFLSKIITLDKSYGDHYEGGRMNCPFELHDNYLELCILVDHSSADKVKISDITVVTFVTKANILSTARISPLP